MKGKSKSQVALKRHLRWVEVDLAAIAHNVREVRQLLTPDIKFTAVVKADAYGHGATAVARIVVQNGADSLGVAYLEEALALRRDGVRSPILVMGPVLPEEASVVIRNRLSVMVDNAALARALDRTASRSRPASVHVKVNLGLFRWGVSLESLRSFVSGMKRYRNLRLDGIFAHPGYMVGKNGTQVAEALDNFLAVVKSVREKGPEWDVHVADSAILMDYPEYRLSRVRVGNLIYGINPSKKLLPLKSPWRALARLVHVQVLPSGQSVGYGGEFVATSPMTVGTLAVGYSHGLTLEPASRWIHLASGHSYWAMLEGIRCPFVGRVGMGHCLVDLTGVPAARVGDVLQLPLRRTAAFNWAKVYKTTS